MNRKEFNKTITISSREKAMYALLTFRKNLIRARGVLGNINQSQQSVSVPNLNDFDKTSEIYIEDFNQDIEVKVNAYIYKESGLIQEFSEWVFVHVVNEQGDWVWEEDSVVNFDVDFVNTLKEQYKRFPDKGEFEQLQETYERNMDDTKRLIARMVGILAYGDNPKVLVSTIRLTEPVRIGDIDFSVIQTQLLSENRFTLYDKPFGDIYIGSNDISDMRVLQKIAGNLMGQAEKLCFR